MCVKCDTKSKGLRWGVVNFALAPANGTVTGASSDSSWLRGSLQGRPWTPDPSWSLLNALLDIANIVHCYSICKIKIYQINWKSKNFLQGTLLVGGKVRNFSRIYWELLPQKGEKLKLHWSNSNLGHGALYLLSRSPFRPSTVKAA